jgi:hypothetical protein
MAEETEENGKQNGKKRQGKVNRLSPGLGRTKACVSHSQLLDLRF